MAASESGVGFSGHTLDKATKAKVTLENYYSNLIAQHIDRKKRFVISLEIFVMCGFKIIIYGGSALLLAVHDFILG